MIRRRLGDSFFLITQHDHALLAAELARHVGNRLFAKPAPPGPVLEAVALHDAGWPIHDDAPTLNDHGEPTDVFESLREVTFPVWHASADRAAERGNYVGLLVSLHVLGLSAFAAGASEERRKGMPFSTAHLTEQFEMNKFQHHEIERQQRLRAACGLPTDIATHLGLAETGAHPEEDRLRFNLRILQSMDQISLALCCTEPPWDESTEYFPRIGDEPITFMLRRAGPDVLVDPWPFDRSEIAVKIPGKRVPARKYASARELHEIYQQSPTETISASVRPG